VSKLSYVHIIRLNFN